MVDVKPDISNIITVEENHQNKDDPRAKTPPIVVCPTKTLNLYSCTMVRKFHEYFCICFRFRQKTNFSVKSQTIL